jgi:transcriptional regulator with XRE-family HTH domain
MHPIAKAMKKSGLSQAELARLTGVPQSTISRVLRGADGRRKVFTPEQANRLLPVVKLLGIKREQLLVP